MWWMYEHKEVLENGGRATVRVRFNEGKGSLHIDEVVLIPKGKRKESFLTNGLKDDYSYRRLNMEDRKKAELKFLIEAVGEEVLNRALVATWESMKPSKITKEMYDIEYK